MERSVTPVRPPKKPEQNAPARKRIDQNIPHGAEHLIRPFLFEPHFNGLKAHPGPPWKRTRYM